MPPPGTPSPSAITLPAIVSGPPDRTSTSIAAPTSALIVTDLDPAIVRPSSVWLPPAATVLWLIVLSIRTLPPQMMMPKCVEMLDGCPPGVIASIVTSGAKPEYVA